MKTRQKAQEPPKTGKRKVDMRLGDLYSACLKNAGELLEEADLLIRNGHYARGYFLGYTAMEELGKSQVVADYFNGMVSQREFEAAFRDHRFKAAYIQRYVQIPTDLKNEWFIEYDPQISKNHAQIRNRSLYVEHLPDHTPQLPEEMMSLNMANELITIAKEYLSEIIKMEYITERIGTKAFTK